jgi:hypothetical protein
MNESSKFICVAFLLEIWYVWFFIWLYSNSLISWKHTTFCRLRTKSVSHQWPWVIWQVQEVFIFLVLKLKVHAYVASYFLAIVWYGLCFMFYSLYGNFCVHGNTRPFVNLKPNRFHTYDGEKSSKCGKL